MSDMELREIGEDNSLLILDDDEPFRRRLARAMEKRGFAVEQAGSVAAGKAIATARPPAYAVVDLRLEDGNGLDVVEVLNTWLRNDLERLNNAGINTDRIIFDPGIGFGKTVQHNVTILAGLSAFQGLGVPVLIGASRKGFIGKLSGEAIAAKRAPGSIAAALVAAGQGAQARGASA